MDHGLIMFLVFISILELRNKFCLRVLQLTKLEKTLIFNMILLAPPFSSYFIGIFCHTCNTTLLMAHQCQSMASCSMRYFIPKHCSSIAMPPIGPKDLIQVMCMYTVCIPTFRSLTISVYLPSCAALPVSSLTLPPLELRLSYTHP